MFSHLRLGGDLTYPFGKPNLEPGDVWIGARPLEQGLGRLNEASGGLLNPSPSGSLTVGRVYPPPV